jgi:hypothetical protein
VDILYLAEGYKKNELGKFIRDVKRLNNYFMSVEPFNHYKNYFNIRAVKSISKEYGIDKPQKNSWKNTILNARFNIFNTDRYLMTLDHYRVLDVAANAPYDFIIILVNTDEYGGGAIYNYLSTVVSVNEYANLVNVHEWGHLFGGLADEYDDSIVPYEDFYDTKLEPWEPNITTLVDFNSKWKTLIADSIPVPTPAIALYKKVVGVFEGAGYSKKSIYRPQQNCWMRSNSADGFCKVCTKTLIQMILYYSK